MLHSLMSGFGLLLSGWTIVFALLGTVVGMFFGLMPGLTASVALATLLPVTFTMSGSAAVAMLGAALGGTTFAGSVTAILLNTPGTPANASATLDGYPMTRQGRSATAVGVSATASAIGALVSVLLLVAVLPVLRELVLLFGPPELFMLGILGLTVIASVSTSNVWNGLIGGTFGLALSLVGISPVSPVPRFAFHQLYLWDGIPLVPTLIGLFAISEMIHLGSRPATAVRRERHRLQGSVIEGMRITLAEWKLVLRSAWTGTLVGAIPGLGGTVGSFMAYTAAKQTLPNTEGFGQGDPRGLIASESAADSKDAGALMPALSFGIPGDPSSAVLIAGLTIHGLFPGKELLTTHLDQVFTLIWALLLANVVTSVIGVVLGKHLARLATVNISAVIPFVIVFAALGAYALRSNMIDMLVAFAFGVVGYIFKRFGYSPVPIIIGLMLGPLIEGNFFTSLELDNGSPAIFVLHPASALFLALTAVSVVWSIRRNRSGVRDVPGLEASR